MKSDRVPAVGLGLFVSLQIGIFSRALPDTFDLAKAIALLVGGPIVLIGLAWTKDLKPPDRSVRLVLGLVCVALCSSLLVTSRIETGLVGQDHRFTGFITTGFSILVGVFSLMAIGIGAEKWLIQSMAIGSTPFVTYGVLQAFELDPFQWNSETFTLAAVFSTQGNPNFAAWTAAVLFPVGLWIYSGNTRFRVVSGLVYLGGLLTVSSASSSFQGPLAVIVLSSVLLVFILLSRRHPLSLYLLLVSTVFHQLTLLVAGYSESKALAALFGFLVITGVTHYFISRELRLSIVASRVIAAAVSLSGTALVLAKWNFLISQLGERRAFNSAAWRMFLAKPWTGHGFEQFGFFYTQFRPAWHAEQLERSVPSSPHSLMLSILIAGGLVLAIPVFGVFLLGLIRSFRRAREVAFGPSGSATVMFFMQIATGFLALVAVEQIAVITITSVVWGLNLRVTTRSLSRRNRRLVRAVVAPVCLILLVFGSALSIRWVQGNRAQGYASRNLDLGEPVEGSILLLNESVKKGPSSAAARLQRAYLRAYLGDGSAVDEALQSAEYFNYVGSVVETGTKIVTQFEEYEKGVFLVRRGLEADSNGLLISKFAREYLSAVEEELEVSGQATRLKTLRESNDYVKVARMLEGRK